MKCVSWNHETSPLVELQNCYFLDLVEGFACNVVINSGCGSSCSGIADWSNISQNGSQSEGAISKHEP
jgi:hypothetical protein